MKNKLKTRSSTIKRFRRTKTGKIIYRKAFHGHLLEKKITKAETILKKKWYS